MSHSDINFIFKTKAASQQNLGCPQHPGRPSPWPGLELGGVHL